MPAESPRKTSPFAIDVLKLVTGTAIAQAIAILASPVLTRLYGPEAFGLFAIFTSIISIIGVIACMRYELAIMLPGDDEEAIHILGLSILMVTVITVFTGIGLFLGSETILSALNAQNLSPYLWLVPPFIFVSGLFLVLNYWNSRRRHFGILSVARITSAVTSTGTQLGAGLAGYTTGGSLIGASLAGSIVSTGVLGGEIWRENGILIKRNLSWKGMVEGMKRYKRFPLIDSISALLNTISWQLPVLLLSAFFSPVIVGFYALGMRVLQTPVNLIGGAIAQVFFQRAAEARRERSLGILVENVFRVLVTIGLFPVLILAIIGGDIFSVIFGEVWRDAGVYAQILAIWVIIWFISSPLSTLYIILEKQDFGFTYNIANLLTRLISLIVGGLMNSVTIALALFAISGIGVYGYLCISMMKFSGVSLPAVKKIVLSNLILFAPVGCLLIGLKVLHFNPIILVGMACLAAIVYYVYIIRIDTQLEMVLNQFGLLKYLIKESVEK